MLRLFRVLILGSFVVCSSPLLALSQGIQQTPYSAADAVRRSWPSIAPDFTPSNPLGLPGSSTVEPRGSDSISISSDMFQGILPNVPNLQLGYNYTFGPKFRAGSASVDYLLPFKLGAGSTIYGEAHGEFQSLSIYQPGSPNNCVELCFGGGYRRMFGGDTMIGLHGFYDKTRLSGNWYSSGSAGVEMAAMVPGHDAVDLAFNWYGQAFDASLLSNSLGFNPGTSQVGFGNANYDFQAGYSHELYEGGPDLRLSITGYRFDTSSNVYGYYGGAELKSRDGVFVLKYDVGYDNVNQVYQSVAAFINTGFQLENLISGKSPFVMPKPVFQSPRNVTHLTEAKVNRNFRHNTQAATLASLSVKPKTSQCLGSQTITIVNQMGKDIKLYMMFQPGTGGYTLPLQGWTIAPGGNPYLITTSLAAASNLVVNFPCTTQYMPLTISADEYPQTGCIVTQFELNLCAGTGNTDTYDISLVNGFNYSGEIKPDSGNPLMACCQTGNSTNPGVYPYSCDICTAASAPPCTGPPGECKAGTQYNPDPPCNYNIPSTNYTVYIGGTPDVPTPNPVWCPTSCPTSTSACTLGAQCNTP